MYAVTKPSPSEFSSLRHSSVLPTPTSPVTFTNPSPLRSATSRTLSASWYPARFMKKPVSGVMVKGSSFRPKCSRYMRASASGRAAQVLAHGLQRVPRPVHLAGPDLVVVHDDGPQQDHELALGRLPALVLERVAEHGDVGQAGRRRVLVVDGILHEPADDHHLAAVGAHDAVRLAHRGQGQRDLLRERADGHGLLLVHHRAH